MINSKIVDAYYCTQDTDDDESSSFCSPQLDKCQIEIALDDCPRFIVQFDHLSSWLDCVSLTNSCHACELEHFKLNDLEKRIKASKEYELFLKKYNKIKQAQCEQEEKECSCKEPVTKQSENKRKENNENCLNCTARERIGLIEASRSDLVNTIANLIGCIGCRTSIERFYRQQASRISSSTGSVSTCSGGCANKTKKVLQNNNSSIVSSTNNNKNKFSHVIYPILIDLNQNLSINYSIVSNPFKLYSIFYLNFSKIDVKPLKINLNAFNCHTNNITNITSTYNLFAAANCINTNTNNSNKNRRCQMHSLDKNRLKSISDWLPVWESFTKNSSRSKTLLIDTSKLLVTLENYLRRHKFCSDCKLKVVRAYNILIGEVDAAKEKGYCAALYDGIECCSLTNKKINESNTNSTSTGKKQAKFHLNKQHLHLKNDKQFIANLIFKAEPEIQGGRRERHAKTLDIAQEEVLTCIGIHLYERFYRIYQAIKLEEQTWQLLVYSSVLTLKKAFELKFEKLQGVSNLELICAELEAELNQSINESTNKTKKSKTNKNRNKTKTSKQTIPKPTVCNEEEYLGEFIDEFDDLESHSTTNSSHCAKSQNDYVLDVEDDEVEEEVDNDFELLANTSLKKSIKSASLEPLCGCSNDSTDCSDEQIRPKSTNNQICLFTSLTSSSSSSSSSSASSTNSQSNYDLLFEPNNSFNFINYNLEYLNYNLNTFDDDNDCDYVIPDEEKNDYYANKSVYLDNRKNRREMLKKQYLSLKQNANFIIRPRNVS